MSNINGRVVEVDLGDKKVTLDKVLSNQYVVCLDQIKEDAVALSDAVAECISYLVSRGSGELIIPSTETEGEVRVSIHRNKGTYQIEDQFQVRGLRPPVAGEARPYTGDDWKKGDIVLGVPSANRVVFAWICTEGGVPGVWKAIGEELEELETVKRNLQTFGKRVGTPEIVISGAYEGADLTVKFADEIVEFSNPWEWIKDRVDKGNFSGLYPGDYIRVDVPAAQGQPAWSFDAQIAGIDTYYEPSFLQIKHHIDWISRDCGGFRASYHDKDNNNGIIEGDAAFTSSALQNILGAVESLLPEELRQVLSDKYLCQELRYSEGSVITQSTGSSNALLGKLWVPTEVEVFGFPLLADKMGCVGQVQYPIFQNSAKARAKKFSGGSYTVEWWLLNLASNSATDICVVNDFGFVATKACNDIARFPICFRIEQTVEQES